MILTAEQSKARLKGLGVGPDKYLGQHFLIDAAVLAKIRDVAESFVRPDDTILEVGPGLGVLTEELVSFGQPVLAIEKDPMFAHAVPDFLKHPDTLTVRQGDILAFLDTPAFPEVDSWCVVANIPYAITSPLLRKLVYRPTPPHDILVLVQKELAERVTAPAGSSHRGLLTVELEAKAEAQIIATVPSAAFWPAPEVASALLHLRLKSGAQLLPASFRKVVAAGFSAKRKKLANSLSASLRQPVEEVRQWLTSLEIDPNQRAETLTLEEWIKLAHAYEKGA